MAAPAFGGALSYSCVLDAATVIAVDGVLAGDALRPSREMTPGDAYAFQGAEVGSLGVFGQKVLAGSDFGRAGNRVHGDAKLTFLSCAGNPISASLVIETGPDGRVVGLYLVADVGLLPEHATLVKIEPLTALPTPCADGLTLTADAEVRLSDGTLCAAGDLGTGAVLGAPRGPASRVLAVTRRQVRDAAGMVVVRTGALGNRAPLVIPEHQWVLLPGRQSPIRAAALVNHTSVYRDRGGWFDLVDFSLAPGRTVEANGLALLSADQSVDVPGLRPQFSGG